MAMWLLLPQNEDIELHSGYYGGHLDYHERGKKEEKKNGKTHEHSRKFPSSVSSEGLALPQAVCPSQHSSAEAKGEGEISFCSCPGKKSNKLCPLKRKTMGEDDH